MVVMHSCVSDCADLSVFFLQAWRMESTAQSLMETFSAGGCPVGASPGQSGPKAPANKVVMRMILWCLLTSVYLHARAASSAFI